MCQQVRPWMALMSLNLITQDFRQTSLGGTAELVLKKCKWEYRLIPIVSCRSGYVVLWIQYALPRWIASKISLSRRIVSTTISLDGNQIDRRKQAKQQLNACSTSFSSILPSILLFTAGKSGQKDALEFFFGLRQISTRALYQIYASLSPYGQFESLPWLNLLNAQNSTNTWSNAKLNRSN